MEPGALFRSLVHFFGAHGAESHLCLVRISAVHRSAVNVFEHSNRAITLPDWQQLEG